MAKSGAHILKLQTYTADTLTIQSNKDDFVNKDKTAFLSGRTLYDLYNDVILLGIGTQKL